MCVREELLHEQSPSPPTAWPNCVPWPSWVRSAAEVPATAMSTESAVCKDHDLDIAWQSLIDEVALMLAALDSSANP